MSQQWPNKISRTDLPEGLLALLFTDIEGSTALLHSLGELYPAQLEVQRRIMRTAFAAYGGVEVDTQGDSFFAVFRSPKSAVAAVVQAQHELHAHNWPEGYPVRVRMGLHCGEPIRTDEGYVGVDLHRTARLMSAGHGGQVLMTAQAVALAGELPLGCDLLDLGEHRLKDLPNPEHIYELRIRELPHDFPALRTLDNLSHNLPARLPPILGRQQEIEALRALLESGQRLTTLLGPGGTGKTRLALEMAALTLDMWKDGVFFVPLAPVATPDANLSAHAVEDAIISAVARELGLRDDGGQNLGERLLLHLKPRQMLLVLDNFEHMVEGAGVVGQWLAGCERLHILATSRVPLNVSGEQEFPVAPLALPRRKPPPDVATMSQYAAVALFIERARAVKPEFSVNNDNAPAIAEICARLDGLPLAIELAAARVKLLPPTTMLARLGKSLSFLVGGRRDVEARQQTLRAAIAWSYDLLGEEGKRLFRRLSVFRGGFGFESAEQVCGEPLDDSEGVIDVFEGVSSLLNQSLLVYRDEVDGESRFAMLETIREFALEELDARGEGEVMRRRHHEWCFLEAERRDTEMYHDLRHALTLFEVESDNWRSAWNWSIAAHPGDALRLASGATVLWNRIGGTREQYERLEASLRAAPEADALYKCQALHFLVQADRNRGDWATYRRHIEQLETLSAEANLPEFQAISVDQRMWDAVGEGRIDDALEYSGRVFQLRSLCLEQALSLGLEDHEIERCRNELVDCMILQAEILAKAGQVDEAWAVMEDGIAQKRASTDESGLTFAINKYGQLLMGTGRIDESRPFFEEALTRVKESTDRSVIYGWFCHDAGMVAAYEGDLQRALELTRDSYTIFSDLNSGAGIVFVLQVLALMYARQHKWDHVARMVGVREAAREHVNANDWQQFVDREDEIARAALGEAEFEAQRRAGMLLDPRQLIESVLANGL